MRVLDVGGAIEAVDGNVFDDRTPVRQERRRTAIGELRVALSWTTETLAVVNVEPDARTSERIRQAEALV